MNGTPVNELEGELGKLLVQMNNSYKYPYSEPIRCDQCSEVINPNRECYILFGDRFIDEDESTTSFRLIRIECQDCSPTNLYYTAPEYTEILLAGRFSSEYTLTDLHLVTASGKSSGLDWNPSELQDILDPERKALSKLTPTDFIRTITMHFDPREVVDPETGEILIPDEATDAFQLMFAIGVVEKEYTDDQLKSLQQSAEGDVSIEDIEQHTRYLNEEMEKMLRDIFN